MKRITIDNNDNCDGVLAYSIQNLAPVLGDHRYSCRVRTVLGKPTLSPLLKPEPQVTHTIKPFSINSKQFYLNKDSKRTSHEATWYKQIHGRADSVALALTSSHHAKVLQKADSSV